MDLQPIYSLRKSVFFRELPPKNGRETPYLVCLWDCIYIAELQIAYAIPGFDEPANVRFDLPSDRN